jgi:hypothetical protein
MPQFRHEDPCLLSVASGQGGAHSDNQHISERPLMTMIECLWNTLLEMAAN